VSRARFTVVEPALFEWDVFEIAAPIQIPANCEVVKDQRWPTAPLFVVNISPSFGEFTAPLRHNLPIRNVTTNSNNLFVNFRWTFTFCVEKS
jgi:hypothetical protein